MPKPLYKFEVDWDHDELYGNANSDITARVKATKPWSWGTGRAGNSSLTTKAKAGKLLLPLSNTDGIFSSFLTAGALFGKMKAGRRCRVLVGSRAAQFAATNSEYFTAGDVLDKATGDFSISGWLYADALTQTGIVNKRDRASATNLGYAIELQTDGTLDFLISDGTGVTTISSTTVFSAATWYLWILTADRSGNAQFYINAGSAEGAASITSQNGTLANAVNFQIGAGYSGSADRFFNGRMMEVQIWDKLLSSTERTWLYHQGNGRRYADGNRTGDGSTIRTSLSSWWELDEESGNRADAHGSSTLIDTNTVLDAEGITNNLVWSGRLETVVANSEVGRLAEARLTAFGNLAVVAAGKPRSTRAINVRTDVAIGTLLTDIGWPTSAGARDLNTGQTTMDFWFFPVSAKPSAIKEINKIEDTELGWFRESERDDVVFENRHYRLSGARLTSQATYADDGSGGAITYQRIPQEDPVQDVYNRITAKVPNQSLASLATLWTLPSTGANSPLVGPGETQRFLAQYPTPDAVTQDIGAVWTTLAENTDYEANSASDGSGTDLSGSLTLTLTKALDIMVISIKNDHATLSAYITLLQARGQAVQAGDVQELEEFDQTSIDNFGDREYPVSAEFVPNVQEAINQVRYLLANNKDIAPKMSISFLASKDIAHTKEAATRRLSDKLVIISNAATKLGLVSEKVFVERIDHRVTGGGEEHWVDLVLSAADKSGGLVIVLDTGPGTDTGILGY